MFAVQWLGRIEQRKQATSKKTLSARLSRVAGLQAISLTHKSGHSEKMFHSFYLLHYSLERNWWLMKVNLNYLLINFTSMFFTTRLWQTTYLCIHKKNIAAFICRSTSRANFRVPLIRSWIIHQPWQPYIQGVWQKHASMDYIGVAWYLAFWS